MVQILAYIYIPSMESFLGKVGIMVEAGRSTLEKVADDAWMNSGKVCNLFSVVESRISSLRMFPKIGVPQIGWFIMENSLKWMIWGYHYFRNPPSLHSKKIPTYPRNIPRTLNHLFMNGILSYLDIWDIWGMSPGVCWNFLRYMVSYGFVRNPRVPSYHLQFGSPKEFVAECVHPVDWFQKKRLLFHQNSWKLIFSPIILFELLLDATWWYQISRIFAFVTNPNPWGFHGPILGDHGFTPKWGQRMPSIDLQLGPFQSPSPGTQGTGRVESRRAETSQRSGEGDHGGGEGDGRGGGSLGEKVVYGEWALATRGWFT